MEPVNLILVGCGMMGARHVRGMGELEGAAPGSLRLAAVCDIDGAAAEKVAAEAEELLGERPRVFADVAVALAEESCIEAADVVTGPRSHDALTVALLEAGVHVICEKPIALTVARGRRMVDACGRTGKVLAVGENNRRDPMMRLSKACIEGGIIGDPNLALQIAIGGAGSIIATAWRHRLAMGGVLLDVSVHLGYILESLMGPIETVCARAQIAQPRREGKTWDGSDVAVDVDAEDAFVAALEFESGAQGHWTSHFASPGETLSKRLIIGSEGTLDLPGDRSGNAVRVRRGSEEISGDALVAELPEYGLNEIETRLFGERPGGYSLEGPVTDRKLLAAELHDFVDAIRNGRPPEVDGEMGLRSISIIYAILESARSGESVRVEDVVSGAVREYQEGVEAAEL